MGLLYTWEYDLVTFWGYDSYKRGSLTSVHEESLIQAGSGDPNQVAGEFSIENSLFPVENSIKKKLVQFPAVNHICFESTYSSRGGKSLPSLKNCYEPRLFSPTNKDFKGTVS
jgi:hypothetical protein